LTVESVAWISETKGLLAAAFSLTALICYVQYANAVECKSLVRRAICAADASSQCERSSRATPPPGRLWIWYVASSIAFLLALLSKPTAVPLPLIALAIDYWWLGRPGVRTLGLGVWVAMAV